MELRKQKNPLAYYTDNRNRSIQTDIYTKPFPILDGNIIIYCSVPRALHVLCDKQNWNDHHILEVRILLRVLLPFVKMHTATWSEVQDTLMHPKTPYLTLIIL